MNIAIICAIILTGVIGILSLYHLKDFKLNTKSMARIALVAALCITLYVIKLVPFPQGGGCSLLSILPLMIFASIFGISEGLVCAIIIGTLKIIVAPPYFPLQLPLDYYGPMLAIALTPLFGTTRIKLGIGALLATSAATFSSVLSGVLFFAKFAPEGMDVWLYSIIYNATGFGVEASISVIILVILPLGYLSRIVNKKIEVQDEI